MERRCKISLPLEERENGGGRRGDWGGRSLFLKRTGYPGEREGQQNDNNNIICLLCLLM